MRRLCREVSHGWCTLLTQKRFWSGLVFVVGSGDFGQLGLGEGVCETRRQAGPALLELPGHVKSIACGGMHSMALSEGKIYACGVNDSGQLGHDHEARARLLASTGTCSRVPAG